MRNEKRLPLFALSVLIVVIATYVIGGRGFLHYPRAVSSLIKSAVGIVNPSQMLFLGFLPTGPWRRVRRWGGGNKMSQQKEDGYTDDSSAVLGQGARTLCPTQPEVERIITIGTKAGVIDKDIGKKALDILRGKIKISKKQVVAIRRVAALSPAEKFGLWLRVRRRALGVSIEEIAALAEISPELWRAIEHGATSYHTVAEVVDRLTEAIQTLLRRQGLPAEGVQRENAAKALEDAFSIHTQHTWN